MSVLTRHLDMGNQAPKQQLTAAANTQFLLLLVSLQDLFLLYLKDKDTETEIFPTSWFTPQTAAIARAVPDHLLFSQAR